jgi:hypothetical protein
MEQQQLTIEIIVVIALMAPAKVNLAGNIGE